MLVIQQYKGIFLMWCRISLSFHSLHFYSVWFSSIVIPRIAVCLYSENKNLPTVHFPPAQPRDRWEIEQLIFLTGTQLNPVATVKKKKATHEEWECVFVYVHEIQPQIYTQGCFGATVCSQSTFRHLSMQRVQSHDNLHCIYPNIFSTTTLVFYYGRQRQRNKAWHKHKLRKECAEKSKDWVGQASRERGK